MIHLLYFVWDYSKKSDERPRRRSHLTFFMIALGAELESASALSSRSRSRIRKKQCTTDLRVPFTCILSYHPGHILHRPTHRNLWESVHLHPAQQRVQISAPTPPRNSNSIRTSRSRTSTRSQGRSSVGQVIPILSPQNAPPKIDASRLEVGIKIHFFDTPLVSRTSPSNLFNASQTRDERCGIHRTWGSTALLTGWLQTCRRPISSEIMSGVLKLTH